jgi:small ubiquitin-related modifier
VNRVALYTQNVPSYANGPTFDILFQVYYYHIKQPDKVKDVSSLIKYYIDEYPDLGLNKMIADMITKYQQDPVEVYENIAAKCKTVLALSHPTHVRNYAKDLAAQQTQPPQSATRTAKNNSNSHQTNKRHQQINREQKRTAAAKAAAAAKANKVAEAKKERIRRLAAEKVAKDNRTVRLVVKDASSGTQLEYAVKANIKLTSVFTLYSNTKQIDMKNVTFTYVTKKRIVTEINNNDTVNSMEMKDGAVIVCTKKKPISQEELNDRKKTETLTIRIVQGPSDELFFKLRQTTKMGKVFSAYCTAKNVVAGSFMFYMDGQVVSDEASPFTLGLEDFDQLDSVAVVGR